MSIVAHPILRIPPSFNLNALVSFTRWLDPLVTMKLGGHKVGELESDGGINCIPKFAK